MTTKTVSIQGYDSAPLGGARRSRSRKAGGGGGGAMMQVAANSGGGEVTVSKVVGSPVSGAPPGAPISSIGAPLRGGGAAPMPAISITAAPTAPAPATLTAAAPAVEQHGGKMVRVELKKSTTQKKVHLNPKRDGPIHVHKKDKTKKNRRITLGLVGLHKRLTRAKKIHHRVKEMPLAELKAHLVKRGLIKESSKAPESVIRQIAADAQIVVGSAL